MRNFVQPGHVLTFIGKAGGHLSGDLVIIGAMFGISAYNTAEGAEGELNLGGVFNLPKATGAAMAVGEAVYWDATNKLVTKTAIDNTKIGVVAVQDEVSAGTTVNVRLNDSF